MPSATVNGIEMYYELQGEGAPLLLVHGLGTGSADWEFQVPALAARYRVIAPCLRGFGRSARPAGPYSIELFAQDLDALLDHLGVESCHVAGVSMGGAVGFQFAVDYTSRVRSLIAINSQPSFELNTFKKRMLVFSRSLLVRTVGLELQSRIQLRRNFPGRRNRALRRRLSGRFANDIDPYLDALDAIAGWTVLDRLDRIRVPVLFVTAELDYSTPDEKARYAGMLHDARVVTIPGARHAAHLERPDEVNAAMLSFLQGVGPGQAGD